MAAEMLSAGAAVACYVCTLAAFVVLALGVLYFNKSIYSKEDSEEYMMARNSQGSVSMALSFFASGAGAWVFFTLPEAAILGGPIAVAGYTISCVVPLIIIGCVGPYFRRELPNGYTFFEYIQARFGTAMNVYCTLVSLFYLFLYLSAEFSSVGSCVVTLSKLEDPLGPVIATSLVTLAYTSIGGMPVSLVTDKVQGVGVFILAIIVSIAAFSFYTAPTSSEATPEVVANWDMVTSYGLGGTAGKSFKMAIILISAVTCANMMHSGYQQRIWAAQDDKHMWRGAIGGSLLTMPLMVFFGVIGMVAFANFGIPGLVAVGPDKDYLAFLAAFFLVIAMGPVWQALAIILAVMMVASSADTIQTGAAALLRPITTYALDKISPGASANPKTVVGVTLLATTVLINIPAIALSTAGVSVLSLFVLADLVCATAIVPLLLGLWPRLHPFAAVAGCLAGLACALVIFGVSVPDTVTDELENFDTITDEFVPFKMLTQAGGLYSETSFVGFIVVPVASGVVTLIANIPFLKGYRFAGYGTPDLPEEAKDNDQAKAADDEQAKTSSI